MNEMRLQLGEETALEQQQHFNSFTHVSILKLQLVFLFGNSLTELALRARTQVLCYGVSRWRSRVSLAVEISIEI